SAINGCATRSTGAGTTTGTSTTASERSTSATRCCQSLFGQLRPGETGGPQQGGQVGVGPYETGVDLVCGHLLAAAVQPLDDDRAFKSCAVQISEHRGEVAVPL